MSLAVAKGTRRVLFLSGTIAKPSGSLPRQRDRPSSPNSSGTHMNRHASIRRRRGSVLRAAAGLASASLLAVPRSPRPRPRPRPSKATVTGYAPGTSDNNQAGAFGDDCVKLPGEDPGDTFTLTQDYRLVVVKAGSEQSAPGHVKPSSRAPRPVRPSGPTAMAPATSAKATRASATSSSAAATSRPRPRQRPRRRPRRRRRRDPVGDAEARSPRRPRARRRARPRRRRRRDPVGDAERDAQRDPLGDPEEARLRQTRFSASAERRRP